MILDLQKEMKIESSRLLYINGLLIIRTLLQ